MAELASAAAPSVVLVHGGFVDGSGWESVYEILRKDGYVVSIVQNPTTSLADDVAATKRVLATQADTSVTGRLSTSRQGEVSRLVRG